MLTIGILCAQRTLIHAGSMIDGEDKKMKNKQTIVVENDVIVQVVNGYLNAKPEEILYDLKTLRLLQDGWIYTYTLDRSLARNLTAKISI